MVRVSRWRLGILVAMSCLVFGAPVWAQRVDEEQQGDISYERADDSGELIERVPAPIRAGAWSLELVEEGVWGEHLRGVVRWQVSAREWSWRSDDELLFATQARLLGPGLVVSAPRLVVSVDGSKVIASGFGDARPSIQRGTGHLEAEHIEVELETGGLVMRGLSSRRVGSVSE